jgi:hypothetical protein
MVADAATRYFEGDLVEVDPALVGNPLMAEWVAEFGHGPFRVLDVRAADGPGPQAHPQEFLLTEPDSSHPLRLSDCRTRLPLSGIWFTLADMTA